MLVLRPGHVSIFAALASLASAQTPFGPKCLSTGDGPTWVAVGDVSSDARADIVASNGDGTLRVFRALGGAAFSAGQALGGSGSPCRDLELADIDLDGDLDIVSLAVSTSAGASTLAVYRNLTTTFGGPSLNSAGIYAGGVAIGDLSGDGWPDVVVCNAGAANTLKLFLNSGAGTFGAAQTIALGSGAGPRDVALLDVELDGDLDIATANGSSSFMVLVNSGAANFGAPLSYPTPSSNATLAVGDWNADGYPDLALFDYANELVVLTNNGSGGFGTPATSNVGFQAQAVARGDFDGDGRDDLVATTYSGESAVMLGLGGAFGAPTWFHTSGRFGIALGDLDGDGRLDAAVARDGADQLGIFLGDGHGGFGGQTRYEFGASLVDFRAGDLNGDGREDLVVADVMSACVQVRLALPSGGYAPLAAYPIGAVPTFLELARIDAGPTLDAFVRGSDGLVRVLFGDGAGHFSVAFTGPSIYPPNSLALDDVNGDGLADLAYPWSYTDGAGYLHQGTSLFAGNGFGGFSFVLGSSSQASGVAIGDFNEDGIGDVARAEQYEARLWLSNGAGGFTSSASFPATNLVALRAVDLDGDNHFDLVGADTNGGVRLLRGDGSGNLSAMTSLSSGGAYELIPGDFDGDGDLDLVALSSGLQCLENVGGGTFVDRGRASESTGVPTRLAAGDANADGRLDLLVGAKYSGFVVSLRNRGAVAGPVTYCVAKTTSNGCVPSISASGASSATATSGFTVSCVDTINRKRGMLAYSFSGRAMAPFQGGTLCVKSPLFRTPVVQSNGNPPPDDCSGVFAIDMNAFAHGGIGGAPRPELSLPGTSVTAQWIGRDPLSPLPGQSTLSNAIDFVVGP